MTEIILSEEERNKKLKEELGQLLGEKQAIEATPKQPVETPITEPKVPTISTKKPVTEQDKDFIGSLQTEASREEEQGIPKTLWDATGYSPGVLPWLGKVYNRTFAQL